MWKYIVTYLILKSVPCPVVLDEFGRPPAINTTLLGTLPCYKTDSIQKEKVFDDYKEAKAFISRGHKENDLINFAIDSVPAKQYNCQHLSLMVTMMGCPEGVKCNSATCTQCGKITDHY